MAPWLHHIYFISTNLSGHSLVWISITTNNYLSLERESRPCKHTVFSWSCVKARQWSSTPAPPAPPRALTLLLWWSCRLSASHWNAHHRAQRITPRSTESQLNEQGNRDKLLDELSAWRARSFSYWRASEEEQQQTQSMKKTLNSGTKWELGCPLYWYNIYHCL